MKKLAAFIFVFLQLAAVYGQKLTVQVPKVVAMGESFQIVFSTNEQYDRFTPPSLSDFRVIAGPVQGSSFSNINGQASQSFSITYYVTALKEGKFTIGQAEAVIGGKTVNSESYTIEVVKADPATQQRQAAQGGGSEAQPSSTNVSSSDLYARVELNRSSLYRGEAVVASVKIYTRVGISGASGIKLPTFTGFYSQEMDVPESEARFHRENVNGTIYNVAVLKRYVLIPQQTGTLMIPPFEMNLSVEVVRQRQSRSLLDDFMDSPFQSIEKKIVSPTISVTVKDLPAGAPMSFKGAVGSFKIDASVDKQQTQANQAIAYSLSISGTGNLKLVEEPPISFPPDFDKYDPKINESIKTTTAGSVGSKKFEYALIPRSAGDFTIPAVEFSYFDPAKSSYVTLKTKDINLSIEKDPNAGSIATTQGTPGVSQQNIRHLGKDIIFIKTTPLQASTKGQMFFASLPYYLLLLVLVIIFLFIYFVLRKKVKESGNAALMRNKTANKVARRRLTLSSVLLKEGNVHGFYEELLKAMWGYVSDKLNIPVAGLSRENMQESLQQRNVQQTDIDAFLKVIDECEFARYAPNAERSAMEHVYDNAIGVISKFEQTIR